MLQTYFNATRMSILDRQGCEILVVLNSYSYPCLCIFDSYRLSIYFWQMSYPSNKSVLVFSDLSELKSTLTSLATNRGLFNLYIADKDTDILAVPCFMIILDASKMSSELQDALVEIYREADFQQPRIFIVGNQFDLPDTLKSHCVFLTEDELKYTKLKSLVYSERKRENNELKRQLQFQARLKRIIALLEEKNQSNEDLLEKYKISVSTLKRDLAVINNLFCDSETLNHADRITRILSLHLELEENFRVYKSEYCRKFNITERTFQRDLDALNKTRTENKILSNGDDCYS
jgi:hypothetical protein